MRLKQTLQPLINYLHHHRGQRRSAIVLSVICIVLLGVEFSMKYYYRNQPEQLDQFTLSAVDELEPLRADSSYWTNESAIENNEWRKPVPSYKRSTITPFTFDPNTADKNTLLRLGLSDKTATTIINYRNMGGRFKKPEDLLKIYSLKKEDAIALQPFIRIAGNENKAGQREIIAGETNKAFTKQKWERALIDINDSDTSAWISLPGIGSKLANRIINFRNKLGGFYSVAQVAETYGLPDSTFQKIRSQLKFSGNEKLQKLDVNALNAEELSKHPYIKFNLAKAIVNYRLQHGSFEYPEDLKRIMILEDAVYNKLLPYITVGPAGTSKR